MQFIGSKTLRNTLAAGAVAASLTVLTACGGSSTPTSAATHQPPAVTSAVPATTQAVATPAQPTTAPATIVPPSFWTPDEVNELTADYNQNPALGANNVKLACLNASLVNKSDPTSALNFIKAWRNPAPASSTAVLDRVIADCDR